MVLHITFLSEVTTYSVSNCVHPWGVRRPGCDADHSHPLVPSLRMSGVKNPARLYAFMAWKGSNLPFLIPRQLLSDFEYLASSERNGSIVVHFADSNFVTKLCCLAADSKFCKRTWGAVRMGDNEKAQREATGVSRQQTATGISLQNVCFLSPPQVRKFVSRENILYKWIHIRKRASGAKVEKLTGQNL